MEVVPFLLNVIRVTTSCFNQWTGVIDVVSMAALLLSTVCCSMQPEELTLLLIKLRRQQAELNSLREHTVAQLMALGMEGPNAKVSTECIKYLCVHAANQPKQSKSHILCVYLCPQGEVTCIRLVVYSKWNCFWCVLKGSVSWRQYTYYDSSSFFLCWQLKSNGPPFQTRLKYK